MGTWMAKAHLYSVSVALSHHADCKHLATGTLHLVVMQNLLPWHPGPWLGLPGTRVIHISNSDFMPRRAGSTDESPGQRVWRQEVPPFINSVSSDYMRWWLERTPSRHPLQLSPDGMIVSMLWSWERCKAGRDNFIPALAEDVEGMQPPGRTKSKSQQGMIQQSLLQQTKWQPSSPMKWCLSGSGKGTRCDGRKRQF